MTALDLLIVNKDLDPLMIEAKNKTNIKMRTLTMSMTI